MGDLMSPGNYDGIGYTAVDPKGEIFGERWLFNEEAFKQRKEKFTKPRKIDKEKTKDKERRDSQLYYLRLTVGTALSSLIIMLINGVVYFVKILPVLEKLTPWTLHP